MTPDQLNIEIDKVTDSLRSNIMKLKEDTLSEYKLSIINLIFKSDNNIAERATLIWNEIIEETYDFDRKSKLNKELAGITIKDVLELFENSFFANPHKLSIQVISIKKRYSHQTQ